MAPKTAQPKSNVTKLSIMYVPDAKLGDVLPLVLTGKPEGYLPVDQLELQDEPGLEHTRRPAAHPKNLETVYRAFQVADGTDDERCAQLRIRSMYLGDAVLVDNVAYYVSSDGFVTRNLDGTVTPVEG